MCLVDYIRSKEVLGLISKILSFTEEDMIEVGLMVSQESIVTSLFQTLISPLRSDTAVVPKKAPELEVLLL